MENFIESLVDRPWLLVLSIMAVGTVISVIALTLRELFLKLDRKLDPLARMEADMLRKASPAGALGRVSVSPIYSRASRVGFSALFCYDVGNPNGINFVVHRAGFLNRPLTALPPEVGEVPEELASAGFTLRFAPPEMYPLYAGKFAPFAPFLGEHVNEFALKGGGLTIEIQGTDAWPEARLKELLDAGAAGVRAFM